MKRSGIALCIALFFVLLGVTFIGASADANSPSNAGVRKSFSAIGTVSAVEETGLIIQSADGSDGSDNVEYLINTINARFQTKSYAPLTRDDIFIGDRVIAKGYVEGGTIIAQKITSLFSTSTPSVPDTILPLSTPEVATTTPDTNVAITTESVATSTEIVATTTDPIATSTADTVSSTSTIDTATSTNNESTSSENISATSTVIDVIGNVIDTIVDFITGSSSPDIQPPSVPDPVVNDPPPEITTP